MNNLLYYSHIPIKSRKGILLKLKHLITKNQNRIITSLYNDLHKPIFESKHMEIIPTLNEIEYHLEYFENWIIENKSLNPLHHLPLFFSSTNKCYIERLPFGKVLIIATWNYPIHLSLLPLIGAVSAGNSVMLVLPDKNYTHHTSNLLYKLFKIYFPETRYINVMHGGKENIDHLLKYKWDFIFYTGSKKVGEIIYKKAAEKLTPTVLELGGKSPCIINSDINNLLIKRIVWGKFTNAGQTCIAPDYLLINKKYASKILKEITNTIIDFYGVNPIESLDLSRIVNKDHYNRLNNIIEKDNNHLYYGGQTIKSALYIQPTILDFGDNIDLFLNSESMKDEIFGPIIPVFQYNTITDVLKVVDKHPTPLTAYLFGNDVDMYSKLIKSGSVVYNDTLMQMDTPLPFGGIGTSGIGNYHGKYTFDTFSYQKSILKRGTVGEIPLRFPPYNNIFGLSIMQNISRYVRNSRLIYNSFFIFLIWMVFLKFRRYFKCF